MQSQAERALTPIILANLDNSEEKKIAPYLVWPYDRVASPDTNDAYLLQGIIDIFSQAREKLGCPLIINSGYRTIAYQAQLRKRGLKAASISPHEHGTALDISLRYIRADTWCKRAHILINCLTSAARNLGLHSYLRYGFRAYDCGFVHVDIVPLLFVGEWKKLQDTLPDEFYPYGRENPRPRDWKGGVTW